MNHVIALLLALIGIAEMASAADTQPAVGTPPARVVNPRPETDLTRIEVSPEAERRLGLRVGVLEQRSLQRTRVLGGEVVGASPAGGRNSRAFVMQAPSDPVQAAKDLVAAEGEVQGATVDVETATVELKRAQKILTGGAGSARAVDEASAKLAAARARLEASQRRRDMLTMGTQGAPTLLWVRVPVYAGDVPRLAADASARVTRLGQEATRAPMEAKPAAGPPSANPAAATVDLYFQLQAVDEGLRPGEKVDVALRLRDAEQTAIVPWSAVLYDVHGGEWIYEQTAPQTFVRRRVQVSFVSDGFAALANGPPPGTQVVIEGAAELFSTEFGVGK